MADFPTYTDPTSDQALTSTDYTSGAGQIDQQAALNEQTYAQNRASTIRSFQDTLDNLSFGLNQAGLQARGAYAGRNLYNASGSLSGTGELVGTELTQPIVRQMTSAQQAHATNLRQLGTQEAQGRLNVATAKTDLLKSVLANLTTRAKESYNVGVDSYNAGIKQQEAVASAKADEAKAAVEAAKLPGGAIDTLKVTQDQQGKGRTLLYQKDLAPMKAKYGADALIRIGNQTFLLSSKERLDLAKAKKDLNKTTGTGDSTETKAQKTLAYNTDLNKFSGAVVTSGAPGAGQVTREQIIEAMVQDYLGLKSRADITKEVYAAYGDTYR